MIHITKSTTYKLDGLLVGNMIASDRAGRSLIITIVAGTGEILTTTQTGTIPQDIYLQLMEALYSNLPINI